MKIWIIAIFIIGLQVKPSAQNFNQVDSLGRKQGIWFDFYDNNKLLVYRKFNYVDNRIDGKIYTYTKKGALKKVQYYVNDRYIFHKTYFTSGSKRGQIKTLHGLKIDKSVSKFMYSIDSSEIKTQGVNSFDLKGNKDGLWYEVDLESFFLADLEEYYAKGKYINGKREGTWYFYRYEEKQLKKKVDYCKGVIEGKYIQFNRKGDTVVVYNVKNGQFNGEYLAYYDSGGLRYKGQMKDNRLTGEYYEYSKKGKVMKYIKDASIESPY